MFRQGKGGNRTQVVGTVLSTQLPETRTNTSDPAECPRQESNLDLPLRRTKDGAVRSGVLLVVAKVLGDCRAWRSSAIWRDWAGFRRGIEATA
jgi:hypothetical protein